MSDWSCVQCDKPLNYEPQMCCSGYECGCMGLPVDPPVCSTECYNKAYGKEKKTTIKFKQRISTDLMIDLMSRFKSMTKDKKKTPILDINKEK